jgi:Rrf2 family transcriptional regulator, nitric oxide-sensitive transcriptional repressor
VQITTITVISKQLTKFSALRVLMYTHAAGDRRVTIAEIAAAYRISRAHLMKVVNLLTRAGYLTALRGRSGGVVLARPAEDICLGEVLRATEPAFAIVECFSTNSQCVFTDRCRLARVLDQADGVSHCVGLTHARKRSVKAQRLPCHISDRAAPDATGPAVRIASRFAAPHPC